MFATREDEKDESKERCECGQLQTCNGIKYSKEH